MAIINLFGAGGHAKVIHDIIEAQGDIVHYMYDDNPRCDCIHGIPVFRASEDNVEGPIIISIGSNYSRKLVSKRISGEYAKAIHPQAIVSKYAAVGEGSVVMQGACLQSDVKIGRHCIINTSASVDHECRIGNFVHVSPHATLCGNVSVGDGTLIGAGTVIIPGVKIGKWCVIGAGSVVIQDVPDNSTVYGNPAKKKELN